MKKLLLIMLLSFGFTGAVYAAVDINTATQSELETLQGIGPAKAKAIIEYREKNGLFESESDLVKVSGIGSGIIKRLGENITVGDNTISKTEENVAAQ